MFCWTAGGYGVKYTSSRRVFIISVMTGKLAFKSFAVWVALMVILATYFPITTILHLLPIYWWYAFAAIASVLVIYFSFKREELSLKTWFLIVISWIILTTILYFLLTYILPSCDGCAVPL